MKTVKYPAIIIAFLVSFSVRAVCPVQETTVMYINGVDVKQSDAQLSSDRILNEVTKEPGIRSDCLHFDFVYNTNELIFADWMESYFQKAGEASDWWRSYLRLNEGNAVLVSLFNGTTDLLADFVQETATAGQWVLGDQKAEHIARFQKELGPLPTGFNRRLVLVPHSQGNLYANEEYAQLTPTEQANTRIVATATPSSFVADNGPYVSVNEDKLASTIFALVDALPTNTENGTERCQGDFFSINRWLCHGFKEEYLADGKPSRDKILSDIIASLPTTQTQFSGTITNSTLFLTGFVPDSDSWVFTRGNYDTPDYQTWVDSLCLSSSDTLNLAWLTTVYSFSTGPDQNFTVTGVNLNDVLPSGPDECGSPGTFYLAVYDFNGSWRQRIFKGVLILHRIDATHWVGEVGD